MNLYDLDYNDVENTIRRRARKEHKCTECRGLILKGEYYTYTSMLYDGEWEAHKICEDCYELRERACKHAAEDYDCINIGFPYGGLQEYTAESEDGDLMSEMDAIIKKRRYHADQ